MSRTGQIRRIQANPVLAKHLLLVLIQTPGGPQVVNALVVSVLTLWLGGFDLTRLSDEKRRLLILLQEDAEEAFARPFVVTPVQPPQQPKAPPPPPPAQDQAPVSVYEMLRAVAGRIEAIASRMEQEDQQLEARLVQRIEQHDQQVEQRLRLLERQQNAEVAWMAEKGHELHTLTTRVTRLEAPAAPSAEPPGEARRPRQPITRQQALEIMPYHEYLQTPEWKALRDAALKRAWYRCQMCNNNKTPLHVHHRTYERRGHEHLEDLLVLCQRCHALFHAQQEPNSPRLEE